MLDELIVLWMLSFSVAPAMAQQVSIGIGINVPLYPELVPVPGYPVYYSPQVDSNYFFYDGMYWVYQEDNWYASSWYNGPWALVGPDYVPLFVLRIPVRYYRRPPAYFRGWQPEGPPRWGEHWGNRWSQQRSGWDRWNHAEVPERPPLPVYQRKYSADRYPRVEQQQAIQSQNYHYQPRDPVVRQQYETQREVQSRPNMPPPVQHEKRNVAPGINHDAQERPRVTAPPAINQGMPGIPPAPPMQAAPRPDQAQRQQREQREAPRPPPQQTAPQRQQSEQRVVPQQPTLRVEPRDPREPHDQREQKQMPPHQPAQESKRGQDQGRGNRGNDRERDDAHDNDRRQ